MGVVFVLFLHVRIPVLILEVIGAVILTWLSDGSLIIVGLIMMLLITSTTYQTLTSGALLTSLIFFIQSLDLIIGFEIVPEPIQNNLQAFQKLLGYLNLKFPQIECFLFFHNAFHRELLTLLLPVIMCLGVSAAIILNTLLVKLFHSVRVRLQRSVDERDVLEQRLQFGINPILGDRATSEEEDDPASGQHSVLEEQIVDSFTELISPDALLSPATEIEKLLIQILSSTLFLLFYSQYYIVTQCLSLLRCRDDGYVSVYPFILCDYSRHSQHVYLFSTSIAGFVAYGVILSCIWIYLIRINRQGIKNNSSKLNAWYGFFHSDFKARYKWWICLFCFEG